MGVLDRFGRLKVRRSTIVYTTAAFTVLCAAGGVLAAHSLAAPSNPSPQADLIVLRAEYSKLEAATATFRKHGKECGKGSQALGCIERNDAELADEYAAFGHGLSPSSMPDADCSKVTTKLALDAGVIAQSLRQLAATRTVAAYKSAGEVSPLLDATLSTDEDYGYLTYLLEHA